MSDTYDQLLQSSSIRLNSNQIAPWKRAYRKTLHEQDERLLTQCVMEAEGGIYLRMQELCGSSSHIEEHTEIQAAGHELL